MNQLQRMWFRNTGCLNKALTFEKHHLIVLAIYYKLRRYDPSDKLVQTYRNKEVLPTYKLILEEKLNIKNTFIKYIDI